MVLLGRDDFAALAARILRPGRLQAREARAVVKGIESPRRAWGALSRAGLVPERWIDGKERRFLSDPLLSKAPGDRDHAAIPPSIAACLVFASDPEGAAAAEALASVVAERLAPWALGFSRLPRPRLARVHREFTGEPLPPPLRLHPRILWRCVSPRAWESCNDATARPHEAAHLACGGPGVLAVRGRDFDPGCKWGPSCLPASLRRRVGPRAASLVEDQIAGARAWNNAVTLERVVPPDSAALRSVLLAFPPALVGRRFADLADPFAPLMALWATGYALEAISEHTITLVAPESA